MKLWENSYGKDSMKDFLTASLEEFLKKDQEDFEWCPFKNLPKKPWIFLQESMIFLRMDGRFCNEILEETSGLISEEIPKNFLKNFRKKNNLWYFLNEFME